MRAQGKHVGIKILMTELAGAALETPRRRSVERFATGLAKLLKNLLSKNMELVHQIVKE